MTALRLKMWIIARLNRRLRLMPGGNGLRRTQIQPASSVVASSARNAICASLSLRQGM